MVKRYESYIDGDGVLERGQHPTGEYVLYTDHAAEMREVLEAINRYPFSKSIPGLIAVFDKYRHYLDKGE